MLSPTCRRRDRSMEGSDGLLSGSPLPSLLRSAAFVRLSCSRFCSASREKRSDRLGLDRGEGSLLACRAVSHVRHHGLCSL